MSEGRPRNGQSVLLVTRNFPPLVGGMEKLNLHLLRAISIGGAARMCGPQGAGRHAPPMVKVDEAPLRPLPWFLTFCLMQSLRAVFQMRPAFVLAGSGLTAPIAFIAARLAGARSAAYLHGLDIIVPNAVYQWLWLPFIRRCDVILVNSRNTERLAVSQGIPRERICVLNPGTDIPAPASIEGDKWRRSIGADSEKVLLSVGRFTQRKGLAEFVSKALPLIVAKNPRVRLVVIGAEATDAVQAKGGERYRIEAAASAAGVLSRLSFLGQCDDATLMAAYAGADLHVFPVLEIPGDVEGFGMVALEAAASGLPTVAFSVGGVSDAVQDGITGRLVSPGDYEKFSAAVCELLDHGRTTAQESRCRTFAESLAWPAFNSRLMELLSGEGQ